MIAKEIKNHRKKFSKLEYFGFTVARVVAGMPAC